MEVTGSKDHEKYPAVIHCVQGCEITAPTTQFVKCDSFSQSFFVILILRERLEIKI